MRGLVAVVSVGAVGGTVAGGLLHAGESILLVDGWFENIETIRRSGLSLTLDGERTTHAGRGMYVDELDLLDEPIGIVFLACKSYETVQLVRAFAPYLAADGVVVSLQNGINEDAIATVVGPQRTIGCVVHYSCSMPAAANAVRLSPSGWRSFTVGELKGAHTGRLTQVVDLLRAVGHTSITDDIFGALWAKLAMNCMVNGLTAVTGFDAAALWRSPTAAKIMVQIAREAATVAQHQGRAMAPIYLPASGADIPASLLLQADDPVVLDKLFGLIAHEGEGRSEASKSGPPMVSSMQQDIQKGRRPELEYLNGYVIRQGAKFQVATPANRAVADAVQAVAVRDARQGEFHIQRIAKAVLGASAVESG